MWDPALLLKKAHSSHERPLRRDVRLPLTLIGEITHGTAAGGELSVDVPSDIRMTPHQEGLHHDGVRKHTEMSSLIDVRGDSRCRQIRIRTTVNGIEYLCRIESLSAIIDPVEDLAENLLIGVLHNGGRHRDPCEPPGDLLNMGGELGSIGVGPQPRERTTEIEQVRQRDDQRLTGIAGQDDLLLF